MSEQDLKARLEKLEQSHDQLYLACLNTLDAIAELSMAVWETEDDKKRSHALKSAEKIDQTVARLKEINAGRRPDGE